MLGRETHSPMPWMLRACGLNIITAKSVVRRKCLPSVVAVQASRSGSRPVTVRRERASWRMAGCSRSNTRPGVLKPSSTVSDAVPDEGLSIIGESLAAALAG